MRYPVGTLVKLSETSEFYLPDDEYNPLNTKGIIVEELHNDWDFDCKVSWDTGTDNTYLTYLDLIKYEEPS